jgi:hypothetical protein
MRGSCLSARSAAGAAKPKVKRVERASMEIFIMDIGKWVDFTGASY